jgi:hypothetical protein
LNPLISKNWAGKSTPIKSSQIEFWTGMSCII